MPINFDDPSCQSQTHCETFGLCDDQNSTPAYISTDLGNRNTWNAVCNNPHQLHCTFIAVDQCIPLIRADGDQEKRCDGILTYNDEIIFVELKKDRSSGWIPDGINQLKTTIYHYFSTSDPRTYRKRRAFLANSKRPHFHYGHKEQMEKFRHETGVRLSIHNHINIP